MEPHVGLRIFLCASFFPHSPHSLPLLLILIHSFTNLFFFFPSPVYSLCFSCESHFRMGIDTLKLLLLNSSEGLLWDKLTDNSIPCDKVHTQKTVGRKGSEWCWLLSWISKDETKWMAIHRKDKINLCGRKSLERAWRSGCQWCAWAVGGRHP